MPNIELEHDADCPEVTRARVCLREACEQAGIDPRWSERVRPASSHAPPTIRIDGRDLADWERGLPECCRRPAGQTAPTVELIAKVLAAAESGSTSATGRQGRWSTSAAVLPGVLAALLPRIGCPACWPAYASFLGAVGLPILMDIRWLLPLTAVSLTVAVGALAVRARSRRGYAPFVVGLAASAVVLIGKFMFDSNPATYMGTLLLIGASVWNAWPVAGGPERCTLV